MPTGPLQGKVEKVSSCQLSFIGSRSSIVYFRNQETQLCCWFSQSYFSCMRALSPVHEPHKHTHTYTHKTTLQAQQTLNLLRLKENFLHENASF